MIMCEVSVRSVCSQWSFAGVLIQLEWGLHFSNVPGCFLKPETAPVLLKSAMLYKKKGCFSVFTLVIRLRTKLMSGSLLPAATKCSINLSGCRIR